MPTSTTDLKRQIQGDIPEANVRNHLKVLGVFFHLLESALQGQATNDQAIDEFFQRSTYRLQLWLEKIIKVGDEEQLLLRDYELPPLDVALALHSLMLSPHRYFEDSELRFRQLKRLREYPLELVADALDTSNTRYNEVKRHPASEYWHNHTGLVFDAIDSMKNDPMRSVICPACQEAVDVSWKGDRGFTGSNFQHQCPKCQMVLTHDTLRAGKFFQALNRAKDSGVCLPNTAVLVRGELDVQSRCPAIADAVRKCFENRDGQLLPLGDVAALATTGGHSIMAYIAKTLSRPDLVLRTESIPVLLRAFDHSYPFTQDVVDALRHQHLFIRTVYDQGWSRLNSGGPTDNDLDTAYAQYGEFLQRIVTPDRREPGWQDDLIWHTHQLMPERYRVNIVSYIHVFLDHLPRGEDLNGYRPQYDALSNPPSVSVWIKGSPVYHTKGGVHLSSLPRCHSESCCCTTPTCRSGCNCGCCQAGIVAASFLKSEPISDILSR